MARRLAVVTGASRGLGRELALGLAREGYDLVVCARGARDLEAVRDEVVALGSACHVWQGDLTSINTNDLVKELAELPVDVLINNAAFTPSLKLMEVSTQGDFSETLTLNLGVPFLLMQAVMPDMEERGSGTIVNICSLAGRRAIKNASLYCASKFALRGLTESFGQELEGTGVRCFSVSPGGMATSMREELFHDAAQQQEPAAVAHIIIEAIAGRIPVPQGADLVVRGGAYTVVARERWTGLKMEHGQAAPV